MPELPEVEITRRHLADAMEGRVITDVEVGHDRTTRHNSSRSEVAGRLRGRTVRRVGRRGKFLMLDLDDGHVMVAHLGMSGRFSVGKPEEERVKHTHFVAHMDDGVEVRFIDPRTFGFVAVYDEDELSEAGPGRLGPDAWLSPPTTEELAGSLKGRTAPIKALLLDQGPISGLGNIYADEVLHLARIDPLTPGGDLTVGQIAAMIEAVRVVLAEAIDSGGTTLDDLAYLLPDGQAGENLGRLRVYGRTGQPCPVCGTPVERTVVRARSTHYCPRCQGRP